jgi:hypothetical protein
MNELVRNPERLHHQHLRDIIAARVRHPDSINGPVVTDIDLLVRQYGPMRGSDPEGRLFFADFKFGSKGLEGGQRQNFKLIDKMLRSSTYEPERYQGFWIIRWTQDDFGPRFVRAERQFVADVPHIVGHENVIEFLHDVSSPKPVNDLWDVA